MRILFVFSGNSAQKISPFIEEQINSLLDIGIDVDKFAIIGKGITGYLSNLKRFFNTIHNKKYNLIHAHYIWSIIFALFQVKIPVVGTFHGSDLMQNMTFFLAKNFVIPRLNKAIVVNERMAIKLHSPKVIILPCGVNVNLFIPNNSVTTNLSLNKNKINILFSSNFQRPEKNYNLAKQAIDLLQQHIDLNLIELKGFNRNEVSDLLNQVDLLLMTSIWEGSPQIIKEAMACNCPIVSTNVGDVKWLLDGVEGCFITTNDPKDVADKIKKALNFKGRTKGRDKLISLGLDSEHIAKKIIKVYEEVINNTSGKRVYGR